MTGFLAKKIGGAGADPVRFAVREELKRRRREADATIREIDDVMRLQGDAMIDAGQALLDRLSGHDGR